MKYCSKCGKELLDEAVVCVHCGCPVTASKSIASVTNDAPDTAMLVLGFLIPIVGFILYLVNKETLPLKAKSAGKGALAGFCCSIVFSVILTILCIIAAL